MNRTAIWALVIVAAVTVLPTVADAAPPKTPPKLGEGRGQVTLSWDEFVKITGYDPMKKGGQVVTVPWSEVRSLLGDKAPKLAEDSTATVELSWSEFQKLMKWSIEQKAEKPEVRPPTDYIITSSEYVGALSSDGATFTLTLKLNVLRKKGWKRIPVLPGTVALTKVTLKPAEGVFLNSAGGSYELLTDKTGPIEATIEFSVAVRKSAGVNTVSFPRVSAGSSVLDLTVAREKVDVKVAGAQSLVVEGAEGKTLVAAAIPSGVPVTISWERALPKVAPAPTKLYAETRTLVAVADGLLLCQEMVNFSILHTPIRELKLSVPKGASVLTVSGANIKDWRADKDGMMHVLLGAEMIGSYSLRVAYELPAKDSAKVPVIRAVGAQRERGYVGVIAVTNVEIAAGEVTGATKIDARRLPPDIVAMTNQPILLAFRYVDEKFDIPLTIKKHSELRVLVTVVDSALYTAMQLNDGRRITKVVYSVRNNRNQFLRLMMPKGQEMWSVTVNGNTVSPAKDKKDHVLIPLVRSASGSRELASFPVEIVYVEKPSEAVASSGKLRVDLPMCTVPVIHVMYNFYAPAEGKYTVGWGGSGFSGPLGIVEEFSALSTGPGAEVIRRNVAAQAANMQAQVDRRVAAEARKAGATPIRVRLPLTGKRFKLQKVLALPGDRIYFVVQYRDWKIAK